MQEAINKYNTTFPCPLKVLTNNIKITCTYVFGDDKTMIKLTINYVFQI